MNRTNIIALSGAILANLLSLPATAQGSPPFPGPEKEHQWLEKFVGEWTTTSMASMGPDQPPMECSGTIHSRRVGELWVVNEMESVVQDAPMQGLQTVGYDASKRKYVGTWIDSMVNHMWLYEGTVDQTGKKLTLEAEGPNFMGDGKLTKFQDAYEFKTPDHILVTSSMLGEDDKWVTFMTGEAKRVSAKTSDH